MGEKEMSPIRNDATPDPLAWFDELVKEHPKAESYRPRVNEVRNLAIEALQAADAEVQRAQAFMQEKLRRYMIELVTTAFDKQSTYTTAILSIGYVGLFTAWSQTASLIPAASNRFVLITAITSLCVFILFEVFKMIYGNVFLLRTLKVVKAQGAAFDPELQQYMNATAKSQPWFYVTWITAVALTLLLGLASAGVLVYAHLERYFFPALP